MKLEKPFKESRFKAEVLQHAISEFIKVNGRLPIKEGTDLQVAHPDGAVWTYDTVDEYLADHDRQKSYSYLNFMGDKATLQVRYGARATQVAVSSQERQDIERIVGIFERNVEGARIQPAPVVPKDPPIVFIGHGGDAAWRDLKDHLQDKHGFKVEAYEIGARAGHTIRDILEEMVTKSSFALLIFAREDEQEDGAFRARQNVVHEAGLFQGKLGFARAVVLLEEGVQTLSNLDGVQYIGYSSGRIREAFGDILATLRREFS